MDGLLKTVEGINNENEVEFSFKDYFVPLTTAKAITWIIVIGFIVYGNMLFNGFVWDDIVYITQNPQAHQFNLWSSFGQNTFNSSGQYRPVPSIYFSLLYVLFNSTTFFYHILQLFLHITNSILVFIFLKKFLKKGVAFLLSLVFLVHPIQVESVSYIASSDNPLYFFSGMLALLLGSAESISKKKYIAISLLLLFSLLSKETGLFFLIILFIYNLILKKRDVAKLFFVEVISFLLYCIIRFFVGGVYFASAPIIPIDKLSLIQRIINIPEIVYYYIKTLFFPLNLAIDQQWIVSSITIQSFYFPLLIELLFFILIVLLGVCIYRLQKQKLFKLYSFFLVWFLLGLLIGLQIIPLDGTVADRWFYFPIVGILGLIGVAINLFADKINSHERIAVFASIIILILLSFRTILRNQNYSNNMTLYTHDSRISDNYDIENTLGDEYILISDYSDAIIHLKKSVSFFPYETNLYNLASAYELSGNIAPAEQYYYKALNSEYVPGNQHMKVLYENLAYLLYKKHEYRAEYVVLNEGIKLYPTSWELWEYLAVVNYNGILSQKDALAAAEKAYTFNPSETSAKIYTTIRDKKPLNY